jgi:hypothetical protein
MNYPDDADGDALRRVASDGNDMSRPMDIDFAVAVPDESAAQRVAEVVAGHGYTPQVCEDDEDESWTVLCTRRMLATYEGVLAAQRELDELSRPLDGFSDGWGTFGNTA